MLINRLHFKNLVSQKNKSGSVYHFVSQLLYVVSRSATIDKAIKDNLFLSFSRIKIMKEASKRNPVNCYEDFKLSR